MRYLQITSKKDKKFLNDYKERVGRDYQPTFLDNVPQYMQVDENLQPVIIEQKVLNQKQDGFVVLKNKVILSQDRINKLKSMGQPVEIITPAIVKELKAKEKEIQDMISKARIEAVEAYKKEIDEAEKKAIEKQKNGGN